MAAQNCYEKGDHVEWKSGQGKSQGIVKEVIKESKAICGNTIDGSKDDPRYIVENDTTGNATGHRDSALSQTSENKDAFEQGDSVKWNSAQGEVKGKIRRKLTSETQIKDYTAQASQEEPQYLVVSDETGSKAAHKPKSLRKV